MWLQKPGVNTLAPLFELEGAGADAKIKSFSIQQSAPADFPTLRSHHLTVRWVWSVMRLCARLSLLCRGVGGCV